MPLEHRPPRRIIKGPGGGPPIKHGMIKPQTHGEWHERIQRLAEIAEHRSGFYVQGKAVPIGLTQANVHDTRVAVFEMARARGRTVPDPRSMKDYRMDHITLEDSLKRMPERAYIPKVQHRWQKVEGQYEKHVYTIRGGPLMALSKKVKKIVKSEKTVHWEETTGMLWWKKQVQREHTYPAEYEEHERGRQLRMKDAVQKSTSNEPAYYLKVQLSDEKSYEGRPASQKELMIVMPRTLYRELLEIAGEDEDKVMEFFKRMYSHWWNWEH